MPNLEETEHSERKWKGGKPQTFSELFDFYHSYLKPLYAEVQTENVLPQELLFEMNAGLDHIARCWTYQESEEHVVAKAYSHFKRGCLDVFKIRLVTCVDQRKELAKIDVSAIDNGQFHKKMNTLFAQIKKEATKARREEGRLDTSDSIPAFELWESVFIKCIEFEESFYQCPHVNWAKSRGFINFLKQHSVGFAVGVAASLAAALVWKLCVET
jgi:hypothetical protein